MSITPTPNRAIFDITHGGCPKGGEPSAHAAGRSRIGRTARRPNARVGWAHGRSYKRRVEFHWSH